VEISGGDQQGEITGTDRRRRSFSGSNRMVIATGEKKISVPTIRKGSKKKDHERAVDLQEMTERFLTGA
jgi:hypothetical protein